ncbi:11229_t:CDS:2 [Gigaspora margarita]|uniref:11229_t:CDS:1 n=1 Tax=Gigaspora margarita TaxID=4874 RepID=A0ABN7UIG6_GIGMA|nr:11229_t:CDS:2 [Gigaspora margarita]
MPSHPTENDFQILHRNTSTLSKNPDFSVDDIVLFFEKFVIENSEQYITITHVTGIKVGHTLLVSSFFKCIKNETIYVEVTDIDCINTFNTNYNKQEVALITSNISSDIDLITKEIKSTISQAPKKQCNPIPKSSNQDEDLRFITKKDPISKKESNLEGEEKDPNNEEELDN